MEAATTRITRLREYRAAITELDNALNKALQAEQPDNESESRVKQHLVRIPYFHSSTISSGTTAPCN